LPDGPGEVLFDHISFGYNRRPPVLKDVSFRIPAGKTVALVGASESGKTSVARLLLRFWEPAGGRILLDGIETSAVSLADLRNAISIVPQDVVLFDDSIHST
jgi:ATP-binding cassette subfamily B protein